MSATANFVTAMSRDPEKDDSLHDVLQSRWDIPATLHSGYPAEVCRHVVLKQRLFAFWIVKES